MNPGKIRAAIATALAARPAWDGVDIFRYPPGDRAERENGFALGEIDGVTNDDLDLSGTAHEVSYEMAGGLWVAGSGATDDDFKSVEDDVLALLADFQTWIKTVDHGKTLGATGVTVDFMDLATWDLSFTPAPAALIEFTLDITEII